MKKASEYRQHAQECRALARTTQYWRTWVGVVILLIASVFPYGIGGILPAGFARRLRPPHAGTR